MCAAVLRRFTHRRKPQPCLVCRHQVLQLVVLPANYSRAVLTNQAVGLLQNTSLMAILGLVELLGISRSRGQSRVHLYLEVYLIAAVYWLRVRPALLALLKFSLSLPAPPRVRHSCQ